MEGSGFHEQNEMQPICALPDPIRMTARFEISSTQKYPENCELNNGMVQERRLSPQLLMAVENAINDTNERENEQHITFSDSAATPPVRHQPRPDNLIQARANPAIGTVAPITQPVLQNHYTCNGDVQKIRRPPNAFFLFAKENRKKVASLAPHMKNAEVSTRLGEIWQRLPAAAKQTYVNEAKVLEHEHKLKYPTYIYRPTPKGQKVKGRKRKDENRRTKIQPAIAPHPPNSLQTPTPNATIYPNLANAFDNRPFNAISRDLRAPVNTPTYGLVAPQTVFMNPMVQQQAQNFQVMPPPLQAPPEQRFMPVSPYQPRKSPSMPHSLPAKCPNCAFPLTSIATATPQPKPTGPKEIRIKVIAPETEQFDQHEPIALHDKDSTDSQSSSENGRLAIEEATKPAKRGRGRPKKKATMPKIKMRFGKATKKKNKTKKGKEQKENDFELSNAEGSPASKTLEDGNMSQGAVGQMVNSLTRSVQQNILPEDAQDLPPMYSETLTNDEGDITTVESQRTGDGFETVIRHFKRSPSATDFTSGGENGSTPNTGTPEVPSCYSGGTTVVHTDEGDYYQHSSGTDHFRSASEPSSQEQPTQLADSPHNGVLLPQHQIQRSPLNFSMPNKGSASSNNGYASRPTFSQSANQQTYGMPMSGMYMPVMHGVGSGTYVYPAAHSQQYQQTETPAPITRVPLLYQQQPPSMPGQFVMHWPTQ